MSDHPFIFECMFFCHSRVKVGHLIRASLIKRSNDFLSVVVVVIIMLITKSTTYDTKRTKTKIYGEKKPTSNLYLATKYLLIEYERTQTWEEIIIKLDSRYTRTPDNPRRRRHGYWIPGVTTVYCRSVSPIHEVF